MPANTNPIFLAERKNWGKQITAATGTATLDLVSAGNYGSLIESISATTTATGAVEVDLKLYDGSSTFALGSFSVAAGAGTDGGTTDAVEALNQTELPWLRDDLSLSLATGCKLQIAAHAALATGKVVDVVAFGGDY
jgi:hypothetical protein